MSVSATSACTWQVKQDRFEVCYWLVSSVGYAYMYFYAWNKDIKSHLPPIPAALLVARRSTCDGGVPVPDLRIRYPPDGFRYYVVCLRDVRNR